MADVSKIVLPNQEEYDIKDSTARSSIPTAVSQLTNDSGYITASGDLVDYVKTVNCQSVEIGTHNLVQRFDNMFVNTEYPSVATTDDYPIIPSSNSGLVITAGTPETAPHGIKIVANSSARPFFTWFSEQVLKTGYTYTWSFDAEWRLLSDYSGSNTYTFDTRVAYTPAGGNYTQYKESFATIQPGVVQTARVTRTFTVTTEVWGTIQLRIMPSFPDAGPCRANTDYIKISNLMLEEGSTATDWCPSRYITTPAWLCYDTYTKSEVYTKNEVLSRIRTVLGSTPAGGVTCTLSNCTGTLASLNTFNFYRDTLNKMVVVSGRIRITNFARTGNNPGVIINDVDFGTRSSSLDVRGGIVCNQNGIITTEMVDVSISTSGTMYVVCTETYANISGKELTMIIPQAIIAY